MKKSKLEIRKIKNKVIFGMSSLILREVGMKILSVFGQLFLVRLLLPEYFGVFAIISFIVTTVDFLLDLGLTQAVIQNKTRITKEQLSTIFYIKFGIALGFIILFYFISPFFKLIYHQLTDENITMVRVLSTIFLIRPIQSNIISMMDRELEYKIISLIDVIGISFYYLAAIILALLNFQVWSFIYAILIKEIIEVALALRFRFWMPTFHFSIKKTKKLLKFGLYYQIGSVLFLLHNSMIPLIGGLRFSSNIIGLLDWSRSIALLPNTISENFGRVAMSGMSRIQERVDLISLSINKSVSLLNIIVFLFLVIVGGFGREIILYVFTEKWLPALPALYWFTAGTLFLGGNIAVGHGLLAIGRAKEQTIIFGILTFIEFALAIIFARMFGFVGISIAYFIDAFALFVGYYILGIKFGMKLDIKSPFINKLIVVSISFLIAFVLNYIISSSFTFLLFKCGIVSIMYIYLSFLFSKKDTKELVQLLKMARNTKKV